MNDDPMIEFAQRWMPFNGSADEEIFPTFGLQPDQFYLRVVESLDAQDRRSSAALRSYCVARARKLTSPGWSAHRSSRWAY
ncbi:hypothetical protein ACWFOS_03505 [Gordonia terrae]